MVKNFLCPMVIPNYGCVSFNVRGEVCRGTKDLDINKWCKKCLCYNEKLIDMLEE